MPIVIQSVLVIQTKRVVATIEFKYIILKVNNCLRIYTFDKLYERYRIFAVPNNRVNNSEFSQHVSEQLEDNTTVPIDLKEEFDSLNLKSLWSNDIYIAQEPVRNENIE